MKVTIDFGAMAPTLSKQLAKIGLSLSRDTLKIIQRDADAITRLYMRGLLSDSQTLTARRKLMKMLMATLNKEGKKA